MQVINFVLHRGQCPCCGKTVKAILPAAFRTGFGPRLSASVAQLAGGQGGSRSLTREFFSSVLGISISLGAIQKIIDRVSAAITPHYEAIGEAARNSEVKHIDETSYSKKNVLQWLWVMTNTMVAFFMIHPNRSKEAFKALIGDWVGIPVSDGYGLYRKWVGRRQTCLAHLIRKAREISEKTDPRTGPVRKVGPFRASATMPYGRGAPNPRAVAGLLCPLHPTNHLKPQSQGCRRSTCPPSGKRACLPVAFFGKRGRCPHQQPRGTNPALRRAVAKALPGYRQ